MKFPLNKAEIEKFRQEYPTGTRVELVKMNDVQAPLQGTKGTVIRVDDAGNLLVKWDDGSFLNVILGVDQIVKLD